MFLHTKLASGLDQLFAECFTRPSNGKKIFGVEVKDKISVRIFKWETYERRLGRAIGASNVGGCQRVRALLTSSHQVELSFVLTLGFPDSMMVTRLDFVGDHAVLVGTSHCQYCYTIEYLKRHYMWASRCSPFEKSCHARMMDLHSCLLGCLGRSHERNMEVEGHNLASNGNCAVLKTLAQERPNDGTEKILSEDVMNWYLALNIIVIAINYTDFIT